MPDFAALLEAALGRPLNCGERLAVAVSGGGDSLALLHLAATAFPGRVSALTVDHGLRPASAGEAAAVAALCADIGVSHVTLHWEAPRPHSGVQAAARTARYALMGDWCVASGTPLLLTGHHADDQAETLLMRLGRGGGIAGLAGIRAIRILRPGVTLLRPMLGVRRAELAAIVARLGWAAINDPSNDDPRYTRTRVRALLAAHDVDVPNIAAAASHLGLAEEALDWATARAWAGGAIIAAGEVRLDVAGLPDELVRRLTLRAIAAHSPAAAPDGHAVALLIQQLHKGGTATLCGVKATGGAIWRFRPAPPRRKTR